jgi:type VI secretion system protein ImpA
VSSPPVLDVAALVLPIPGAEARGGVPLPEPLRAELERLRRPAPESADAGGPGSTRRPAPDFRAILEDGTHALANTSKDLALVLRVVEAATKVHGTAGLRDGLRLAHRVVADCWDWVYPATPTGRGNRFKWLNSTDGNGADFPLTVQKLPLIDCGSDAFCHFDTLDPARAADLDAALSNCKDDRLLATLADLTDAADALYALSSELKKRLGDDDAPDFTSSDKPNLGTALRHCLQTLTQVAGRRNLSPIGQPAPEAGAALSPNSPAPTAPPRDGGSRDDLYAQIDRIALALKRIEPHSPVPYLLERCVKLGKMPFPELMRSVLRDGSGLAELDRLLGLDQGG